MRNIESKSYFPQKDYIQIEREINSLLYSLGQPINERAKTIKVKQGDPIYFITTLSPNLVFPVLTKLANKSFFEKAWQQFNNQLMQFYAQTSEITAPIWRIDEFNLGRLKSQRLEQLQEQNPQLAICSTERVCFSRNALRLELNRVIPLTPNGDILKNEHPSNRTERPGAPALSKQIAKISQAYQKNGQGGLLLEDTGFASGGSIKQVATMLKKEGVQVIKVVGGLGWFPKAVESLQEYKPECLIWFDLPNGGWVEDRDYCVLPQTGILIAETDEQSGKLKLAKRLLPSGFPIAFDIPDIAFDGRWFRITNPQAVKAIRTLCIQGTIDIYSAISPNLTIKQLAQAYFENGSIFTLPVNFGNLYDQLSTVSEETKIIEYITRNFS